MTIKQMKLPELKNLMIIDYMCFVYITLQCKKLNNSIDRRYEVGSWFIAVIQLGTSRLTNMDHFFMGRTIQVYEQHMPLLQIDVYKFHTYWALSKHWFTVDSKGS